MAHQQAASADSTDGGERHITFNIKASNDQKFVLTLPVSTSVADLKAKLSTSEYADVPAERIRLIYSGRVLKDADTLGTYKVADGNTIHMVKGAASNARQNPASSSSTAGSTAPVPPAVPNMATGTGNNPLAGLTGARYAGFHGLPNASMFGADGGMGAPPGPDEMLRMLDDPNFAQIFNESMNNPDVLRMLEQQPMIANNPMLRNMLRNPEMRRMMFSPEMLRMQLQMQRSMGGGGETEGAFPMPGATDTTPGTTNTTGTEGNAQQQQQPPNPFGSMGAFGGAPSPHGSAQANPFGRLFDMMGPQGTTPAASPPPANSAGGQGTPSANADPTQQNPFANLFGGAAPPAPGAGGNNAIQEMAQQIMQNPDMMRAMFGGPPPGAGDSAAAPGSSGGNQANPFAALFGPGGMAGMNPWGMGAGGSPAPPDDRPPEERYAEQLRQLNDMGFFEFERNVQALRRSGGSVQGAIEFLLGGS